MKFLSNLFELVGIRTHRKFRLTIRFIALLIGLLVGFHVSVLIELNSFDKGFMYFSIILIAAMVEFVFADVLAEQSFPYDTERKLFLMEEKLGADAISVISDLLENAISNFVACERDQVCATVHIKAELNDTSESHNRFGLLQLTDYVGPTGGKKGRVTQINQGIIGRCARTETIESVDFADENEYRNSMVREFGFTKEEANQHTNSARSYLAYPLIGSGKLVGVIYFFTTEPQVFPSVIDLNQLEHLAKQILNIIKIVGLD